MSTGTKSDEIYIESTFKFMVWAGRYTIRVWREESVVRMYYKTNDEFEGSVKETLNAHRNDWDGEHIAAHILSMPRVNAVEVVDHFGTGIVLYKNWP